MPTWLHVVVTTLTILLSLVKAATPLPQSAIALSSLPWTITSANGSVTVPSSFPNQVHLALIDAGIIKEPNVGNNEGIVRWVGEGDWTWKSVLTVDRSNLQDSYFLVFQGLDTFCDVYVGAQKVGSADNAFRSWVFDVTHAITSFAGSKVPLQLRFTSAYSMGRQLQHASGAEWFPDVDEPQHGMQTTSTRYIYDYRNWVRKSQSDFGWDWGPAYLPSGPHKEAYLMALSGAAGHSQRSLGDRAVHLFNIVKNKPVSNVMRSENPTVDSSSNYWVQMTGIDIFKQGQKNNYAPDMSADWVLNVTLPILTTLPKSVISDATLSLSIDGTSISRNSGLNLLPKPGYPTSTPYTLTTSIVVDSKAVSLWWPANLGNPKLHTLQLALTIGGNTVAWSERIGFRTMRVNQERVSSASVKAGTTPGTRFQFEVNGVPFYVQGSSLIPMDTFQQRVTTSTIKWLLQSALLAHQNVLRVWGGGIYQTDEFYDMCDEMGMIAWSEAIYACGAYPVTKSFISNAQAELGENVQRLNKHPSMGLWATNNEGEGYLLSAKASRPNGTVYFDQYDYFNNYVLRDVILRNTKSLSFLPSSTTQGYLSMDDKHYVSRYYNSTSGEIYGDKELYNYNTAVSFDVKSYPVARFVNEFGFHSMPSIYTWDRVLTNDQAYDFNSTQIRNHNKHNPPGNLQYPAPANDGQSQMTLGVERYFPRPSIKGSPRRLLAQWAYSTQLFQATYMTSQIAFYRLGASKANRNMGALYWQLNDIWEGSTWSSIEYTGRWKPFHYFATRVQDHVIISPIWYAQSQSLQIYVTSDLWHSVSGTATWTWYDFSGKLLKQTKSVFNVGSITSTKLYQSPSSGGISSFIPSGSKKTNVWLHLQLKAKGSDGQKYTNEQFWQPVPLNQSNLKSTKVSIKSGNKGEWLVTCTGGVAAWVNVEHAPGVIGYFSSVDTGLPSNNFYVKGGEVRKLKFNVYKDTTGGKYKNNMVVRSIWENQH